MFVDSSQLEPGHQIEADVCIVGGGAAGITLATRLAKGRTSVCLLESGARGTTANLDAQALYRGTYSGEVPTLDSDYLTTSRLRAFGGTTHLWAGYCRPLEAIDFETRDWVPNSGWPLSRASLEPYYDAASDFIGIGRFDLDNPDAGLGQSYFEDSETSERVFRFRATRFGQAFGPALHSAKDLTIYYGANVTEVVSSREGTSIQSLRASTLSGKQFTVKARYWVIAAGGIENARLLLASRSVQPAGLGNQHDQVGRYFMEHAVIHRGLGPVAIWPRFPMILYTAHGGPDLRANFVYPTEAHLRREKLLSISISFEAPAPANVFDRSDRALLRAAHQFDVSEKDVAGSSAFQLHRTIFMCECAPNPQSRVRLVSERDALGMPRVELDWRLTGLEIDTIHRYAEFMSRRIAELRMGRMKVATEKSELMGKLSPDAHHHMGTTRMSRDPKQGVVDANCRVHGIDNLYIGGSSVFPTSGAANPTFTILALSLRLADELERRLGIH